MISVRRARLFVIFFLDSFVTKFFKSVDRKVACGSSGSMAGVVFVCIGVDGLVFYDKSTLFKYFVGGVYMGLLCAWL